MKMKKFNFTVFILSLILLLANYNFAQVNKSSEQNIISASGSLYYDSNVLMQKFNSDNSQNKNIDLSQRKSPMLAGLMSAAVPGLGEFYTGNYLKAIIFAVVEAAAITTAIVYNNKGDNKTLEFQNFANQNWSVERYADWTLKNIKNINPSVDPNQFNVFNPDGGVNWSELNRLERALGNGYSHVLPPFGEQQYYELIGKYPQYSHGWSDANQNDTDFHILSQNFLNYSADRGKANDYYNISNGGVIVIYSNHLLSAIDAIWSAAKFNKVLNMKMRVSSVQVGNKFEIVPKLYFRIPL